MAHVDKSLRRGVDVTIALRKGFGGELSKKAVDVFQRVRLRDVRADRAGYRRVQRKDGRAGNYSRPRTTRAPLAPKPIRSANDPVVRAMARVLVTIVSWLGPAGRTGHEKQGARLRLGELERKSGKDRRELERYFAAFRSGGLLRVWQPPESSGCEKGKFSGHCFNMYELDAKELPAELERCLSTFHRAWWPRRTVLAPMRAPGGLMDAAAIAAELKRRKAPS